MRPVSVVFLGDGMADEPLPELGGRTPLEAARTPNMDRIAASGASGLFLTLPEPFPTSSDAANLSVMGYDLAACYPGRGPIEAVSAGVPLAASDVAWRCNLVTVRDGVLLDYSAGHLPGDAARALVEGLQREFGSGRASFHPGVSYRNILVTHGPEFSAEVACAKPDSSQGEPVESLLPRPLSNSPEARRTADFIVSLMRDTAPYLESHPANKGRAAPANMIWPWSPGRKPSLPSFSALHAGRTGAVISAVDVIFGIALCAGMDVVKVPGATGFIDTNYEGKAAAAVAAAATHDLVYLHVEAPDECSHMGDLSLKLRAIEDFDSRIVGPVMDALAGRPALFAVLPDHPVPIALRKHTRTPVPVAICGPGVIPDHVSVYSERAAAAGALGLMRGDAFMRRVLGLP